MLRRRRPRDGVPIRGMREAWGSPVETDRTCTSRWGGDGEDGQSLRWQWQDKTARPGFQTRTALMDRRRVSARRNNERIGGGEPNSSLTSFHRQRAITNLAVENEPSFYTTFGFHENRSPTGATGRETAGLTALIARRSENALGGGRVYVKNKLKPSPMSAGMPSKYRIERPSKAARWQGADAKQQWKESWNRRR
jgi:hypothetical protein